MEKQNTKLEYNFDICILNGFSYLPFWYKVIKFFSSRESAIFFLILSSIILFLQCFLRLDNIPQFFNTYKELMRSILLYINYIMVFLIVFSNISSILFFKKLENKWKDLAFQEVKKEANLGLYWCIYCKTPVFILPELEFLRFSGYFCCSVCRRSQSIIPICIPNDNYKFSYIFLCDHPKFTLTLLREQVRPYNF